MLPDPYMPSYRYNDAAPVRRSTLVVLACLTLIGVTGSAVGLALTPPDSDLAQLSYLVLLGLSATGLVAVAYLCERRRQAILGGPLAGPTVVAVACGVVRRMTQRQIAVGWRCLGPSSGV
jgi:Na+/proline symporter